MSDLDEAIERLNPDASPKHLYRGPSNTADVEDDLRLVVAAARERDALAAMIEEARSEVGDLERSDWLRDTVAGGRLDAILSRAPADALVERDARIRAEVIDWIDHFRDDLPNDEQYLIAKAAKAASEHFGLTEGAARG